MRFILITLLALTFVSSTSTAQEIAVPDLKGLSVPAAAHVVAQAGLLFKGETQEMWVDGAPVQPNQVSAQEPAAGQAVQPGTGVMVTVLRVYNAEVLYNEQQIVVMNSGKTPLNLAGVSFRSGEANTQKTFAADEWGEAALEPGTCYSLVLIMQAKTPTPAPPTPCVKVIRKLQTAPNNIRVFWQSNFQVLRNDHLIATCTAASGSCEIALPQGDDTERASYLNFNYRDRHLSIRNDSTRWMVLSNIEAAGFNGKKLRLDMLENVTAGDVPWSGQRLAPGQCIVYSEFDVANLPPYDCQVVGYVKLAAGANFWIRGFTIRNIVTLYTSTCVQPKPGLLSVCIVQREEPLK